MGSATSPKPSSYILLLPFVLADENPTVFSSVAGTSQALFTSQAMLFGVPSDVLLVTI